MSKYQVLPEFRVTLARLKPGERAYPDEDESDDDWMGQRTKLGGEPDWIQDEDRPSCPECGKLMSFVAQVDSVEHESEINPHSVSALSKDQKWMFVDVGMIYVFYCFDCFESVGPRNGTRPSHGKRVMARFRWTR